VTPPKPPFPEHLISTEGAPVRRLPIGAELQPDGGVDFRLWAPRCRAVVVEIEGLGPETLQAEAGGYFSLWSRLARAGMRYRFRLDRHEAALPDPASRFRPEVRRSISGVSALSLCANSSWPLRAIGSSNILWAGCASTRRRQFSIDRKIILSLPSCGR